MDNVAQRITEAPVEVREPQQKRSRLTAYTAERFVKLKIPPRELPDVRRFITNWE